MGRRSLKDRRHSPEGPAGTFDGPGVLGERMLGGGDKGAAGALVRADSVEALQRAVETAYPRSHPAYADRYAVHVCRIVNGVHVFEGAV